MCRDAYPLAAKLDPQLRARLAHYGIGQRLSANGVWLVPWALWGAWRGRRRSEVSIPIARLVDQERAAECGMVSEAGG